MVDTTPSPTVPAAERGRRAAVATEVKTRHALLARIAAAHGNVERIQRDSVKLDKVTLGWQRGSLLARTRVRRSRRGWRPG